MLEAASQKRVHCEADTLHQQISTHHCYTVRYMKASRDVTLAPKPECVCGPHLASGLLEKPNPPPRHD